MPSNNNNTGDFLSELSARITAEAQNDAQNGRDVTFDALFNKHLEAIEKDVRTISIAVARGSQAAARDRVFNDGDSNPFGRRYNESVGGGRGNYNNYGNGRRKPPDYGSFTDELEASILKSILGEDIGKELSKTFKGFAKSLADTMGVKLQDVPGALGRELGTQLGEAFKNTRLGGQISDKLSNLRERSVSYIKDYIQNNAKKGMEDYQRTGRSFGRDTRWTQNFARRGGGTSGGGVNPTEASQTSEAARAAADAAREASDAASGANAAGAAQSAAEAQTAAGAANAANAAGSAAADAAGAAAGAQAAGAAANAAGTAAAGAATAGTAATNAAGAVAGLTGAGSAAASAGAGLAALAGVIGPLLPVIGIVAAALVVFHGRIKALSKSLKDNKEKWDEFKKAWESAAYRSDESAKKNAHAAAERLRQDMETIVKAPFTILEDAAKKVEDAWDNTLRTITGTQGYDKAGLQDLMSAYSSRLREEGLSGVINGADLTENLSKVLESGMSGKVAEEFAYIATKLNAAIPTQDFFNYADTYVELAANRIKAGASEEEAIQYASEQLMSFANDVLYASRQLSGGFTTGLKDASNLFAQSVEIAESSRSGDASQIGGILASISAITGGIAPDLASSIVDAVVKAATGGNSSEIVALRSLAGGNASNTEFLNMFANDPQKVFATLFSNLAKLQTMSDDNYMEVAEGLSSLFGISMSSFARIDFEYLAEAILDMQHNSSSLAENIQNLQSGQTTLTAEQLRNQEINKYMIDQGLAYVLDNEVARSIQEHMWNEQIAREMQEATYGIEIKGTALELLTSLKTTVKNILNFLNPFAIFSKIASALESAAEGEAQEMDMKEILELGKVGAGNMKALKELITRNKDLNLTSKYVEMLGGYSAYGAVSDIRKADSFLRDGLFLNNNYSNAKFSSMLKSMASSSYMGNSPTSMYGWGTVSKSTAAATASLLAASNQSTVSPTSALANTSAQPASGTEAAKSVIVSRVQSMLDEGYINGKFASQGKSYDEFVASAKSMGIADFSKAIQEAGYSEEQVKSQYEQYLTNYGQEQNAARVLREEDFWNRMKLFADNEERYTLEIIDLVKEANVHLIDVVAREDTIIEDLLEVINQQTITNEKLSMVITNQTEFKKSWDEYFKQWVSYFIEHEVYNAAYRYSDVEAVARQENRENGEAVLALAHALTDNIKDLSDPQVQTNALLSQILIVITAIMNQQNDATGTTSLLDTLAGLALGGTVTSPAQAL